MSEEEKQELQQAAGGQEVKESTENNHSPKTGKDQKVEESADSLVIPARSEEHTGAGEADAVLADPAENSLENPEEEIDNTNAEDAEDSDNERRHHIPFLDYHSLSMENLVGELQRLLRTEKVQAIRKHVDQLKREFDLQFQDFLEHKKEEFIERGGSESDFRYNSVTKRQFSELYSEYRDKRNLYYKNLEQNLNQNLQNRLTIIEELKSLVSVEEDMASTYKTFRELQGKWRNAGPVPRANYNDVWRTYHHHVEIFYDFLHLNRELRDLDFKYNLEEKEKLCIKAESLLDEANINKAFRELQILHKIWKEEIGPVAKEQREAIWQRFSEATKKMHQLRQDYFQQLEQDFETNLLEKQKIISQIAEIGQNLGKNHRGIQNQIKQVEALREQFFKAGKVPQKENEATWAAFKSAVRSFNRNKNSFYKNLKKDQQENLDKKQALLQRALELKDSEDWDTATAEMKQIQRDWKDIGHVPRKYSDKIWKEFKQACNHYFDRMHSRKNSAYTEEKKNLELKSAILEELRVFKLSGEKEGDLKSIETFVTRWKEIGYVPRNKKHLNSKFHKILEALFRKLGISKEEGEILKYGNKIQNLADTDDERVIEQERQFVRKKIEEIHAEIRQLENNLNFFTNHSEENPLVKDVLKNLKGKQKTLENWKAKLKKLNILRNHLHQDEAGEADESEESKAEE